MAGSRSSILDESSGDDLRGSAGHVAQAGFGIRALEAADGAAPVKVSKLEQARFHAVIGFACPHRVAQGSVVIIPPLSGVLPRIVRGLILGLLPRYRVLVPEWINPRFVPLADGPFGFGTNIGVIIRTLHLAGPGAGLVGLCQSGVPAMAATAIMAADDDPATPEALVLLGAPIDAAVNPTNLTRHLATTSPHRLRMMLSPVPFGFPGAGRMVYSAELQRTLVTAARLRWAFMPAGFGWNPFPDMAEASEELPLTEHSRAMVDVDATHYLANIDTVFRRRALCQRLLVHDGSLVDPGAIRRSALVTIEGTEDRIVGPGQSAAAHALCPDLPSSRHEEIFAPGCNHLSLFRGELFYRRILPVLRNSLARWLG